MALGDLLDRALEALALELAVDDRQRLLELALLVDRWAAHVNLTGHRGPEGVLRGLVVEALALDRVLPASSTVLDLGSGAGFPGLPIAIVRGATCRVTLLEARQRRHHFQRAAVRELGIENISVLRGRAERLEPTPHELVLAQALARPERAIALMQPWVAPGGRLALALSAPPGLAAADLARLDRSEFIPYRVPLTNRERGLWIATPRF